MRRCSQNYEKSLTLQNGEYPQRPGKKINPEEEGIPLKIMKKVKHCIRGNTLKNLEKRLKKVSEYNQEIPQSQTADKPMAPQGSSHNNHETPRRQTKQSNQLSLPHQDDCKTGRDIK